MLHTNIYIVSLLYTEIIYKRNSFEIRFYKTKIRFQQKNEINIPSLSW